MGREHDDHGPGTAQDVCEIEPIYLTKIPDGHLMLDAINALEQAGSSRDWPLRETWNFGRDLLGRAVSQTASWCLWTTLSVAMGAGIATGVAGFSIGFGTGVLASLAGLFLGGLLFMLLVWSWAWIIPFTWISVRFGWEVFNSPVVVRASDGTRRDAPDVLSDVRTDDVDAAREEIDAINEAITIYRAALIAHREGGDVSLDDLRTSYRLLSQQRASIIGNLAGAIAGMRSGGLMGDAQEQHGGDKLLKLGNSPTGETLTRSLGRMNARLKAVERAREFDPAHDDRAEFVQGQLRRIGSSES